MLLPYDMHVHTYYSPCAHGLDDDGRPLAAPERHYQRAAELGLEAIYFADHFVEDPTAPGVVLYYKASGPAIIHNLRRELSALEEPPGCRVYVGCETETMSTEWVGVGAELARSLDLVLVPTSHYHLPGVPQPPGDGPAAMADHMLDMLQAVVLKPWVDAVAHPLADSEAVIGDLRRIYEAMDPARLRDVLGLAAENGVALEVNAGALLSPELPHYGEVYREVARQARAQGVRFTFGSDAHDYRKLGLSPDVEEWIVATGLNRDDFLTPADIAARRAG